MTQKKDTKGQGCLLPSCISITAALCLQAQTLRQCGAEAASLLLPTERKLEQLERVTVYFPKASKGTKLL